MDAHAGDEDKTFEQQVFLKFWKEFATTYSVDLRNRNQTYLLGTGHVYDTLTRAKFFQLEQMYPFDRKELLRDIRKLTAHIADEFHRAARRGLHSDYGVKPGALVLALIDPALVPAVWLYVVERKHHAPHLLGCVMVNLRLTVAFPHELPLGPEGPSAEKLAAAKNEATVRFDQQIAEDAIIEKRGGTVPKRPKRKLIT